MICEFCSSKVSSTSQIKRHYKTKKCQEKQKELKELEEYKQKIKKDLEELKLKEIDQINNDYVKEKEKLNNYIKEIEKLNNNYKIEIEKLNNHVKEIEKLKLIDEEKINNLQLQLNEKTEQLNKFNDKLFEKATSKTINNTINNNNNYTYLPLHSIDLSKKRIDKVCRKHLKSSILSDIYNKLPLFAKEYIIENENKELGYICSDINRGSFIFRNDKKEIEKDPKAIKFTKVLLEIANPYLNELLKELKPIKPIKNDDDSDEDEKEVQKKLYISKCKKYDKITNNIKNLKQDIVNPKFWRKLAELTYVKEKKILVDKNKENKENKNEIESDDEGDFEQWKKEREKYRKELRISNESKNESKNELKNELKFLGVDLEQVAKEMKKIDEILEKDPEFIKSRWIFENTEKMRNEGKLKRGKTMENLYEEYLKEMNKENKNEESKNNEKEYNDEYDDRNNDEENDLDDDKEYNDEYYKENDDEEN